MTDSHFARLFLTLALVLGAFEWRGASAAAQEPVDPRGAHASEERVRLPLALRSGVRTSAQAAIPIDMEVLTEVITARLGELREESIRRLLAALGARASRPLEDLAGTLADLLEDSSDPAARSQMLVAALVRDSLSYLIAAAAKEGFFDRGDCADDVHVLATTAYEGMAQTNVMSRLGFPLATGEAPQGCGELATAIGTFIELAGQGDFTVVVERLRAIASQDPGTTPLQTELAALAAACAPAQPNAAADLQRVPGAIEDAVGGDPADETACARAHRESPFYEAFVGVARASSRPPLVTELEAAMRVGANAAPRSGGAQTPSTDGAVHEAAEIAYAMLEIVLRSFRDRNGDPGLTRGDVEALLDRLIALIEPKIEDDTTKRIVIGSLRSVRAALRDNAAGGLLAVTIDPIVLISTMSTELTELSVGDLSIYLRANVSLGYFFDADTDFVAAGFEELGVGVRWQPFPDVFLGLHAVTSGILLSITEPGGEPLDVIFAGGGLSVNLFRLVDFSATFGVLFSTVGDTNPRFGMLFGAGVPLADYVAAIADVASEE